jgi:hypothetical protein
MKCFWAVILLCGLACGCAKLELTAPENPIPGNDPPGLPSGPQPRDSSTGENRFVTLRWECEDPDEGDSLRYDVYFGNTNPPPLIADSVKVKSFDVGFASAGTMFFWRITVKDIEGASAESPVWRFTTSD